MFQMMYESFAESTFHDDQLLTRTKIKCSLDVNQNEGTLVLSSEKKSVYFEERNKTEIVTSTHRVCHFNTKCQLVCFIFGHLVSF